MLIVRFVNGKKRKKKHKLYQVDAVQGEPEDRPLSKRETWFMTFIFWQRLNEKWVKLISIFFSRTNQTRIFQLLLIHPTFFKAEHSCGMENYLVAYKNNIETWNYDFDFWLSLHSLIHNWNCKHCARAELLEHRWFDKQQD